ncbi:MAG: hypothetical protein V3V11_08465 [Vicinamibacteria bacterium]
MFVGHYGPSFLAKALDKTIPLWLLFLAVQLVDIFWAIFVLLGIEKVRIVPGFTATNPFDLYYMPYTHSLPATFAWALGGFVLYRLVRAGNGSRGAWLVAAAVASHWLLDLLVHRPDLPLYDNAAKVGLGLWNYPIGTLALEALLLFGGMASYLRATKPLSSSGRFAVIIFGVVMFAIQVGAFLGPPPGSDREAATTGLAVYVVFAAVAYWIEKKRA